MGERFRQADFYIRRSDRIPAEPLPIPAKFRTFESSGLTLAIGPGGSTFDVELDRPAAR